MSVQRFNTKTDWVIAELKVAISKGRVAPGTRMRVQEWAERLGVSTTPVREAFKALEGEGYLDSLPHQGARVTAFSEKDYTEYLLVRSALDALATQLTAGRLSAEEMSILCKRLTEINVELQSARTGVKAQRTAVEFHKVIYASAGSVLLSNLVEPLWRLSPSGFINLWDRQSHDEVVCEHDAIINALRARDEVSAGAAAREHQDRALGRLREIGFKGAGKSTEE